MSMKLNVNVENIKKGTNINDIIVPDKLRERHSTGLDWFDDALGGQGLCPGTVMMLTGTPGAGKTTMCLQIANALTGQGHQSILNTGEESLYQMKMVSERLKLEHGFIAGQDIMNSDALAHARYIMDTRMSDHLDEERRLKVGGKQLILIIDSLQCMNDGKYKDGGTTGMTPVRVVEQLVDFAKSTFANVIFIGQVTKSGDFAGKNTIRHAVDAHGELYIDTDKRSEYYGERMFKMSKYRFGCAGRTYLMGMDDKGLFEQGRFHENDDLRKK